MRRTDAAPASEATPVASILLQELLDLYSELDALYTGVSCPSSSECCRFGATGRQPWVTSIELALILHALSAQGRRAPRDDCGRDAPRVRGRVRARLPLHRSDAEQRCPLLDHDARCSIYASRPFGCRTFYCDQKAGDLPSRARIRGLLHRLQELALRHQPGGDQGRSLLRALGSAACRANPRRTHT